MIGQSQGTLWHAMFACTLGIEFDLRIARIRNGSLHGRKVQVDRRVVRGLSTDATWHIGRPAAEIWQFIRRNPEMKCIRQGAIDCRPRRNCSDRIGNEIVAIARSPDPMVIRKHLAKLI